MDTSSDDSTLQEQQRGEPQAEHGGHGTSVAAWTVSFGVILGGAVIAVAMIAGSALFSWVGGGIMVLATLAGPVLNRAGLGEHSENREISGGPRAVR